MDEIHARSSNDLLDYAAAHLENSSLSFRIHYWGVVPRHYDNPVHKHSFYEICYVRDGEGIYMDYDVEYPLRKETIFLSRPGIRHQIRSTGGMVLFYVAFEADESRSTPAAFRSYHNLATTSNFILYDAGQTTTALIWQGLIEQLKQYDLLTEPFIQSTAYSLLLSFYSAFGAEEDSSVQKLPPRKLALHSFHKAELYIQDNLSALLTVEDVARYMHMSSRHLSRLFHEELQTSCIAYIQKQKIRRAVHLVKHTEQSMTEIAERTGFSSVHYFTRVFTRIVGVPPGKFRSGE